MILFTEMNSSLKAKVKSVLAGLQEIQTVCAGERCTVPHAQGEIWHGLNYQGFVVAAGNGPIPILSGFADLCKSSAVPLNRVCGARGRGGLKSSVFEGAGWQ